MECTAQKNGVRRAVRLHLIRHGYAEHNLGKDTNGPRAYFSSKYRFSKLLPSGAEEAHNLRKNMIDRELEFDRIYTSPLDRAMDTTAILFGNDAGFDGRIMVIDHLRELNYSHPCNERRTVRDLQSLYPTFDFSLMRSNDDIIFRYGDMQNRFMALISEIRNFSEEWYSTHGTMPNIALISHESFLLEFINHYLAMEFNTINNCEIVSIDIDLDDLNMFPG